MKKSAVIACLILFAAFCAATAYAERKTIKEEHNKFGGKTEEEVYSRGDDEYKEGIERIVEHYDGSGKIAKIESYYLDDKAKKDGVYKREQYYKNELFERSKLTKAEFYYTEPYARREGIEKSETFYDKHERKERSEFYYTDKYTKKKLIAKMEVFYDSEGRPTKQVYYDQYGRIITTGVKDKKEWK